MRYTPLIGLAAPVIKYIWFRGSQVPETVVKAIWVLTWVAVVWVVGLIAEAIRVGVDGRRAGDARDAQANPMLSGRKNGPTIVVVEVPGKRVPVAGRVAHALMGVEVNVIAVSVTAHPAGGADRDLGHALSEASGVLLVFDRAMANNAQVLERLEHWSSRPAGGPVVVLDRLPSVRWTLPFETAQRQEIGEVVTELLSRIAYEADLRKQQLSASNAQLKRVVLQGRALLRLAVAVALLAAAGLGTLIHAAHVSKRTATRQSAVYSSASSITSGALALLGAYGTEHQPSADEAQATLSVLADSLKGILESNARTHSDAAKCSIVFFRQMYLDSGAAKTERILKVARSKPVGSTAVFSTGPGSIIGTSMMFPGYVTIWYAIPRPGDAGLVGPDGSAAGLFNQRGDIVVSSDSSRIIGTYDVLPEEVSGGVIRKALVCISERSPAGALTGIVLDIECSPEAFVSMQSFDLMRSVLRIVGAFPDQAFRSRAVQDAVAKYNLRLPKVTGGRRPRAA